MQEPALQRFGHFWVGAGGDSSPGPLLRARAGDLLRVVDNQLLAPTKRALARYRPAQRHDGVGDD